MKVLPGLVAVALFGSSHAQAQSAADPAQVENGAKIYQYWRRECHNARELGTRLHWEISRVARAS